MRDDLDERKAAILRAVVEEYIETAQPVGSGTVARTTTVRVSSATVRNEMAVLEQEGYLIQPHTSAGRIPTDKGYRFFVDHLATPGRVDADRRADHGDRRRPHRRRVVARLRLRHRPGHRGMCIDGADVRPPPRG